MKDPTRVKKIRSMLEKHGLDAGVALSPANSYYFSGLIAGLYSRPITPIIPLDGDPILVLPDLEVHHAREKAWIRRLIPYKDGMDGYKVLADVLRSEGLHKSPIGVDLDMLRHSEQEELTNLLPDVEFRDISEDIIAMRMVKSEAEIEVMKKAAELADFGTKRFVEAARDGISEAQLVSQVFSSVSEAYSRLHQHLDYGNAIELGGYGAFLILSGQRTLGPHRLSSSKRIRRGESVVGIVIPCLEGYVCEEERTLIIGSVDDNIKRAFEDLINIRERVIRQLAPGVSCSEIDETASMLIESKGYGRYLMHRTGHGEGITIHEAPYLSLPDKTVLEPGMVVSVEPGLYMPDFGALRHSDTVLITQGGHEVITSHTRETIFI